MAATTPLLSSVSIITPQHPKKTLKFPIFCCRLSSKAKRTVKLQSYRSSPWNRLQSLSSTNLSSIPSAEARNYEHYSKPSTTMSISFGTLTSLQIQPNLNFPRLSIRCQSSQSPESRSLSTGNGKNELKIGSPIILIEAPPTLKTAGSMPSLMVNAGQVKAGDVGRIVSRKPKDVWAVRLAIGTYLIDGKHFKPLDLDE